ncbi:MAG TPA: decarboxylating 6-phosphogluconate dehydrogenase [Chitinophagaceae bacterium]|nr:decarboxylating 6-phosphogluconate dehydrogenase [Chitinophagaceae bacterium]
MQIGLVGLGKMGWNLALNCIGRGHDPIVYDIDEVVRTQARDEGFTVANSLQDLANKLQQRRVIWLMIPAGSPVDSVLAQLKPFLSATDIIIEGGNSHYKDSVLRATELSRSGIYLLDCGTSGGINGALNGICAMIGGDKDAFAYCEPLFSSISVQDGYLYCGESGSGHFAKMVHNGIEYGMMQSIAEGFEVLQQSGYTFSYENIAKLWNNGSVIRGWLMELVQQVFAKDPRLESIKGIVRSSGEGKWMVETALEKNISTPVIALSLLMRYRSLQEDTFSGKLVASLRNEFGGHAVTKV